MSLRTTLLRYLGPAFALSVFVLALAVLWREMRGERIRDIAEFMRSIPPLRIVAAVALTALSFAILTGYDAVSVRYARAKLPYRRIALVSFLNYAFSQGLGFPLLTGGSVRYRLYSGWGLSGLRITNVIAFASFSFWLGVLLIGGMVFLRASPTITSVLDIPAATVRPIGALALSIVGAYVAWTVVGRRIFRIGEWRFRRPGVRLAVGQLLVAIADWLIVSAVLYVLLPADVRVPFPAFIGIFLLAFVAGIASNVPAGLGVFESVMFVLLPEPASQSALLGTLLAYRAIYHLLPLAVAAALLGAYEIGRRVEFVRRIGGTARTWEPLLAPNLLAAGIFAAGALLLLTSTAPTPIGRQVAVASVLPPLLPALAHALGAAAGMGLILVAPAVQRHVRSSVRWSIAFLVSGVAALLVATLAWEEAIGLLAVLALVASARRHFFREESVLRVPYSPRWAAAVMLALAAMLWIGTFSFQQLDYSAALWTMTGPGADAARALRASAVAILVTVVVAVVHAVRRPPAVPSLPTARDLERAAAIVAGSRDTHAALALTGDKELLFSASGRSFLMFAIERRSWIALGDPVGADAAETTELAWRLRELAERNGGWPAFHLAGRRHLASYVDLGLTVLKIGEDARVSLATPHAMSSRRADLLDAARLDADVTFEVVRPEHVPPLLPELRGIADRWRAWTGRGERAFAVASFDERFVARFPVALLREEGRAIAFASVWHSAEREEIALDLARYEPPADARRVLDRLLTGTMRWAAERRYRWLSLGTAPLSGLEHSGLSSIWAQVGSLPFRLGEHFGSAAELRAYKERYEPVWEPRYLATPPGLALPRTLHDVAALITGVGR